MTRSLTSGVRRCLIASASMAIALMTSTFMVLASSIAHAAEPAAKPAPASGQAVYEYWCATCHAPGPGHPGTLSLQLKYDGKTPAVVLERKDLSPEAVAVFVRQG